jgi:ribonuclease G
MIERVHRYKEKESLFESSGVEKEIASTLDRRVDLPSGGYLVFDYAEAFTVIDVNTGRFVGSRSKNSNQRLEDTITKNNLEAVKEVVRQLRLRDIGGIIVIDFIDMANPKNRASVEDALRQELERDRTKTYVVEISPLGLVEMTRQNVTDGPREILTRKCPTCAGDGIVVSDHTVAMQVERKLRALAAPGNRVQAYKVALHPRVLELVVGSGGSRLAAIEEATRRRFFLVPAEGHIHADHFEVLAEGKLIDLQPSSPLVEGAKIELKLGEVGRYDATAAAGKVEGIDVLVADAAKLVGRKATVTIGRVLEGQAFATIVAAGDAGEGPITFESEAEKPTRAPAKRKQTAAPDGAGDGTDEGDEAVVAEPDALLDAGDVDDGLADTDTEGVVDALEEEDDEDSEAEAGEPGADGATSAKKRTRRGSRGGRRRRRPAGAGAAADGATDDGATADGEADDESPDVAAVAAPENANEAEAAETEAAANGAAPEKPKAPTRRRTSRIHVPGDPDAAVVAPEVIQKAVAVAPVEAADLEAVGAADEAESDVADDSAPEADANGAAPLPDGDAPAVKRKTRRGSRGGKNRRKKPAGAAAGGTESEGETELDDDGAVAVALIEDDVIATDEAVEPDESTVDIAVVEPEAPQTAPEPAADPEPAAEAEPVAERRPELDESAAAESDDPGYVPMSEWLDDFDRR